MNKKALMYSFASLLIATEFLTANSIQETLLSHPSTHFFSVPST